MTFPCDKSLRCGECQETISGKPYTWYDGKPFGTLYCYLQYKSKKLGYLKTNTKGASR